MKAWKAGVIHWQPLALLSWAEGAKAWSVEMTKLGPVLPLACHSGTVQGASRGEVLRGVTAPRVSLTTHSGEWSRASHPPLQVGNMRSTGTGAVQGNP